jgi:hypothetical protein
MLTHSGGDSAVVSQIGIRESDSEPFRREFFEPFDPSNLARGSGRSGAARPARAPDDVLDLARIRRFRDVLVEACFDRFLFVFRLPESAERDEEDSIAIFASNAPGNVITADAWQTDVDDREMRSEALDGFDAALAVGDGFHLMAHAAQLQLEQRADVGIVFDENDAPGFFRRTLRLDASVASQRKVYPFRRRKRDDELAPSADAVALRHHIPAVKRHESSHE